MSFSGIKKNRNRLFFWAAACIILPLLFLLALNSIPKGEAGAMDPLVREVEPTGVVIAQNKINGIEVAILEDTLSGRRKIRLNTDEMQAGFQAYLYTDNRPVVDPFITHLMPEGQIRAGNTYCFALPPGASVWDSLHLVIADLFREKMDIRATLDL